MILVLSIPRYVLVEQNLPIHCCLLFIFFYCFREKLEEMKTIQKLRERPNGVSIITLTLGEKVTKEEEVLIVSSLN